jgi:hypothetical protein
LKKPDKKTERVKIDTDIVIRASTKEGEWCLGLIIIQNIGIKIE